MLQAESSIFVARFTISLKNGSRYKLNETKRWQSRKYYFSHHHWSSHIWSYIENFTFPSLDLDSPWKMGLDTIWTMSIGEHDQTPSWCTNHCFGYSTCYRQNQAFSWPDSRSPWKMGPGTNWTIQIGEGQISHRWGFASILGFLAQLGNVLTWDHQIWNLLKRTHLLIPILSILGNVLYPTKTPPFKPGT